MMHEMDAVATSSTVAEGDEALFPFDLLPPELQTHIFLALDLPSLAAAMRVSSTWRAMIEEPVMWKLKCVSLPLFSCQLPEMCISHRARTSSLSPQMPP
jgi:CO dehydrogenase/acetyl-CoA synthase delta subunit